MSTMLDALEMLASLNVLPNQVWASRLKSEQPILKILWTQIAWWNYLSARNKNLETDLGMVYMQVDLYRELIRVS